MELILSKSYETEHTYHLKMNGVVLSTYKGDNLPQMIESAKTLGKRHQKNVLLCKSTVAHYFIGFEKSFKNPVIFKDEDFVLSNHQDKTILEGPFADIEEAQVACYNLSGERGEVIEIPR